MNTIFPLMNYDDANLTHYSAPQHAGFRSVLGWRRPIAVVARLVEVGRSFGVNCDEPSRHTLK